MTTTPEPDAHETRPDPQPMTAAGKGPRPADAAQWRRPPKFVVVVWMSPEMRARNPHAPLSLDEALRLGHRLRDTDRAPLPDLEAEP